MLLVSPRRRRALETIWWFMGGTIGSLEAVEALDDSLERRAPESDSKPLSP